MEKIEIERFGLSLSAKQVENLIDNARRYRTENIILREEIANLKKLNEPSFKEGSL